MNFIEAAITASIDSGELLAMLNGGEALGAWESEGVIHIFWPEEQWNDAALANLKCVLAALEAGAPERILSIKVIPDQDWNALWAASLAPIVLGQHVRIRQSWHSPDPSFEGIELIIDPKRAFGTGYHATTQLVVEWLEGHIRGGEQILDVGTGSGILAMAAIRLGAASALAVDNDPVAVDCARDYCGGNGFGSELELKVSSFEDLESSEFDVILANLDIRTLPAFCKHLPGLMKKGGAACLSGLQKQDVDEVAVVLDQVGLSIKETTEREEWVCLGITNYE